MELSSLLSLRAWLFFIAVVPATKVYTRRGCRVRVFNAGSILFKHASLFLNHSDTLYPELIISPCRCPKFALSRTFSSAYHHSNEFRRRKQNAHDEKVQTNSWLTAHLFHPADYVSVPADLNLTEGRAYYAIHATSRAT